MDKETADFKAIELANTILGSGKFTEVPTKANAIDLAGFIKELSAQLQKL